MIGISVLAEAKNVAKKSRIMVDRMSGFFRIKRTPSAMAGKLTTPFRGTLVFPCSTGPIRNKARMTARKEMALMTYTYESPPAAIISPLRAGPTIDPVWLAIEFMLNAFGRSFAGTRLGTSAWREGPSNAWATACRAVNE